MVLSHILNDHFALPHLKKKTRNEHKKEFEFFFAAVAVAFVRGPMQKRMREAQHIIFALFMHVH